MFCDLRVGAVNSRKEKIFDRWEDGGENSEHPVNNDSHALFKAA